MSTLTRMAVFVTARAILLFTFYTSGCTGITFQSGDALKSIYSDRVASLKNKYAGTNLTEEIRIAELDDSGQARNRLLNELIFLIDNNYIFWEKNLYNKKAFADFGADVTATSLSTLSGIVSGGGVQGAKSILSFISAGITATRGSFNSHVLQSQNLLAIVSKMRAQRADKLIALQSGMYENATAKANPPAATPLVRYSVDQGLIDLSAYYQAGTFVSALQDIVDKAGKEKAKAEETVNELKGIEKADD